MLVAARANGTTAVATLALGTALFLFWHTFDPVYDTAFAAAGRGPVFYPRILLGIIIVLAATIALQSLFQTVRVQASGRPTDAATNRASWRALPALLAAITLTAGYVMAFSAAGYLLSTIVYALLLPLVFGYRNPLVIGAFALSYAVATWYLFEKVFLIILPKSPWFSAF